MRGWRQAASGLFHHVEFTETKTKDFNHQTSAPETRTRLWATQQRSEASKDQRGFPPLEMVFSFALGKGRHAGGCLHFMCHLSKCILCESAVRRCDENPSELTSFSCRCCHVLCRNIWQWFAVKWQCGFYRWCVETYCLHVLILLFIKPHCHLSVELYNSHFVQ